MTDRLDRLAAAHHGLAPIVVMPDQLGEATRNPMCVDGPLGDSRTYLTGTSRRGSEVTCTSSSTPRTGR